MSRRTFLNIKGKSMEKKMKDAPLKKEYIVTWRQTFEMKLELSIIALSENAAINIARHMAKSISKPEGKMRILECGSVNEYGGEDFICQLAPSES